MSAPTHSALTLLLLQLTLHPHCAAEMISLHRSFYKAECEEQSAVGSQHGTGLYLLQESPNVMRELCAICAEQGKDTTHSSVHLLTLTYCISFLISLSCIPFSLCLQNIFYLIYTRHRIKLIQSKPFYHNAGFSFSALALYNSACCQYCGK
ncbi:hypothetical protein XELAEV_18000783mg [Xenopus laevis]|uniref:Type I interferon 8 n=1 Tax=Xenopus laevis TaxID=8355 RepID=A0A1B1FFT8_XENLA|nr:interferon-like LOC124416887 precursor [Xenopus laevis]ANQ43320.1 type I interferon 8 [Xenopus laevis]OCT59362.1 hypothetical protein XELAEV_18000783mg [Xenopus laevis]